MTCFIYGLRGFILRFSHYVWCLALDEGCVFRFVNITIQAVKSNCQKIKLGHVMNVLS